MSQWRLPAGGLAGGLLLAYALLTVPVRAQEPASAEGALAEAAPSRGLELEDPLDVLYTEESEEDAPARGDPLEGLNRHTFAFNELVDRWAYRPLVRGYQFVVPEMARRSIHHAFDNLDTPVLVANDLLQLRLRDAAETLGDFAFDTAFGAAGLFEVGAELGLERNPSDFGQTLGRFGVASGPYLIIPFLGPSTLRDSFGDIVDQCIHPLTYLIGPGERIFMGSFLSGSSGLATLEANYAHLDALRESSVDFYAAMRSAYLQNRQAMIQAAWQGSGADQDATSPASSFAIFPSSALISASSPSRLMMDEYSERRSASSDTVPFR